MKNLIKIMLLVFSYQMTIAQMPAIKKSNLDIFKAKQMQIIKANSQKFIGSNFKISVQETGTTKIDVSKTEKFQSSEPRTGKPQSIPNSGCNLLGVNIQKSYSEFGLFFPNTTVRSKIFPGALYKFEEIKNQSLTPYNQPVKRNTLNLNTEIFTSNGQSSNSVQLDNFDYSTVNNSWNSLLAAKINGTQGTDAVMKLIVVESKEQLQHELETMNNTKVGVELDIPIPSLPVNIQPSLNVDVTNEASLKSTIENTKSYAVLRIEQTFYSSFLSQKENPGGGLLNILKDNTNIPDDLMMINSIDYGRVFYIVFKSSLSKGDLSKAIYSKIVTDAAVGVHLTEAPVGGKVTTTVTTEEKKTFNRVWDNSEINMSVLQYGGRNIPTDGNTNIFEIIKSVESQNKFSKDNVGSPIRYTMVFAKDYASAFVNVDTKYATHNCGKSYEGKFDVEVTFKELKCSKTNGGSPDVYGSIHMKNISCKKCSTKPANVFNFWKRKGEDRAIEFDAGDSKKYDTKWSLKNLSFNELESLSFTLKANLHESDLGDDDKFESNNYDFKTDLKTKDENEKGEKMTVIENIASKPLGGIYELNKEIKCQEDGNKNGSTMVAKFYIKITSK
jgi:hypothetical protein